MRLFCMFVPFIFDINLHTIGYEIMYIIEFLYDDYKACYITWERLVHFDNRFLCRCVV